MLIKQQTNWNFPNFCLICGIKLLLVNSANENQMLVFNLMFSWKLKFISVWMKTPIGICWILKKLKLFLIEPQIACCIQISISFPAYFIWILVRKQQFCSSFAALLLSLSYCRLQSKQTFSKFDLFDCRFN